MPGVRLLFPCEVEIEPVDRAGTITAGAAREPVLQVKRKTTVTIDAQIEMTEADGLALGDGGVTPRSLGYLVILVDDALARSYTPARGDRVKTLPGQSGNLYVASVTPHAHKFGRNQTWHLGIEDRAPVKT
jgi:hypothetical protein